MNYSRSEASLAASERAFAWVGKDGADSFLILAHPCPVHAGGIERHRKIAIVIDGDDTTSPADRAELPHHGLTGRLVQRQLSIFDARGDVVRQHGPDDML